MPGSEFANPGLRAFCGHTAGYTARHTARQGLHLKGATKKGAKGPPMTKLSSHVTGRS